MNKKLQKVLLLGAACLIAVLLYVQFKPNSFPYTLESEHFTFYYTKTDQDSIHQLRDKLEENYDRIVEDLKPAEMPRVQMNIYPNLAEFHEGINRKEAGNYLAGIALGPDKMSIVSPNFPGPEHSYDSIMQVAVHEFTHVVTNNLTAYLAFPSMSWLYESIACYEADQFQDPKRMGSLLSGKYPTLAQLNKDTQLTYRLGYTIIEYIRDTWGMSAVRDLITSSGNLPAVLGKNEAEFEKGWYEYVKGKYLKTT